MKTRFLLAAISFALIGLISTSCVENSKKYKQLAAQKDSLAMQSALIEADYNETMNILNDIEDGFASIREKEGLVKMDIANIEGKSASKRQKVASEVAQIQQLVTENREKIDKLQKLLDKSGNQNKVLKDAVARMETELNEKSNLLNSLQSELSKKEVQIQELSNVVEKLNVDLTELTTVSQQQLETIKDQDEDLNMAWYCIGSDKELKNSGILSSDGFLTKKKLFAKEFDENVFYQIDIREVTSIQTASKRVKILTSHPQDSYTLVEGEDKTITINITSPQKFWSVSKYLVIRN